MRQKEQRELEQVRAAWVDEQSLEDFHLKSLLNISCGKFS